MIMKDLWILENPVETEIGTCYFAKVKEYEKILSLSAILQYDKENIVAIVKNMNKDKKDEEGFKQIEEYLSKVSFLQLIKELQGLGLYKAYKDLFNFCFHEDVFDKIKSDDELNEYVQLIKEMNHIEFEKINPNPELAYYDKLSRILKEKHGEIITFKSMITSVGLYKDNVLDLTIYSLYEYFDRISKFKNYDTVILFKTVSTEKLDAEPWYKDSSIKQTQLDENDFKYINRQVSVVKDNPLKKEGVISNKL